MIPIGPDEAPSFVALFWDVAASNENMKMHKPGLCSLKHGRLKNEHNSNQIASLFKERFKKNPRRKYSEIHASFS